MPVFGIRVSSKKIHASPKSSLKERTSFRTLSFGEGRVRRCQSLILFSSENNTKR
jgi:hypothetical protein